LYILLRDSVEQTANTNGFRRHSQDLTIVLYTYREELMTVESLNEVSALVERSRRVRILRSVCLALMYDECVNDGLTVMGCAMI